MYVSRSAPTPVVLAPRITPGNFSFAWPTNAAGYSVQMTADLFQPQWSRVDATPDTQGDQYVLTIPATNSRAFYRLTR